MSCIDRWVAIPLITLAVGSAACARGSETVSQKAPPAVVEPIEDSGLNRVVLTEKAAERIGIVTGVIHEVARPDDAAPLKVVPYAAVIYDTHGETLIYLQLEPFVFMRQAITIERIDGDLAVLLDGPAPGTEVVTVGAAELFGIEFGIGK